MALGEYGRNINPKTLLDMNDSEAKFDLADICGARFVVAAEPEGGRRLAEALVKQVTGSDHIKARNMYKGYFEYVPQFKIFIVSNHKFTVDGGSEAIARRLRMLPFEERIPEDERDKLLLDKLRDELSGILNWAIAGCLAWQRDGLGMPDEVKAATREFMVENDDVQQWIDACCIVLEELSEAVGVLYKDFERFSKANGNVQPMKARAFGRKLHDKGFKRDIQGRGNYIRLGIALRTESE
jgi:putative DNA primase/helicase